MAHKFAAVVFSLGCLQASSVMALGLGELTLESFLNEPLKANVDLLNTGDLHQDEIRIRLATREDFEKLGIDRAYFLTSIKFQVTADENGHAQITMTSDDPVLEPYLDFIVEARWPSGRLLREYTVLVDPPVFSQATPVISASKRVEEVEGIPAPAKKKQKSSGTRVDVRKSDLAPGEMPQRGYNTATVASPTPGGRYMINRDDTLWEIALQAKPEGASVHQTMLDIQRLNPDAFIEGNINRVKAGYIVYLPESGDISSENLAAALTEVRQQNDDWREGRSTEPSATSGPSLRISATPDEETAAEDSADSGTAGEREVGASAAALEDMDKAELERADSEQRLGAMEEQVETLQRIVSLKDDQIAALQAALANAGEGEIAVLEAVPTEETEAGGQLIAGVEDAAGDEPTAEVAGADDTTAMETESVAEVEVAAPEQKQAATAAPAPAKPAPVAQAPAEQSGGFMDYILYILGAALVAILGFVFMRRKGDDSDAQEAAPAAAVAAPARDVFSDVELQDSELEVEAAEEPETTESLEELLAPDRENRGYGQRKHDEYASDVDAADALAEADIYIAYGRYPQAMDLLNNAVANEPGNPAYRLKLLEINAEMGERDAAMEQLAKLQEINEPVSLARAEEVMAGFGSAAPEVALDDMDLDLTVADTSGGPGLSPSPIELMSDGDEPLEADFSGLEIEEPVLGDVAEDDLDLSADFTDSGFAQDSAEEDLVIAAESNGMSTKLDLARAYLDMGDDDGARQILEEVAAEGSEDLKAEARALLERIG